MKFLFYHMIAWIAVGFLVSSLSSCREEIDIDLTDTIEDVPVELINTSIYGQVSDAGQKALAGVKVVIRDQEYLTDNNGYFSFENIKADKNGTHIRASKDGYYQHVVTVYPKLNHSLFSPITLELKNPSATFLVTNGGEIPLGEDASLRLYPNTLVYESDGSNFQGTAYVHFRQFEAENPDSLLSLPGEFITREPMSDPSGLAPEAVFRLEITDSKQQALRLAKGQVAELQLNRSNALSDNIAAYYFAPEEGRWIKAGTLRTLTDNNYSLEISSLDLWCLAKAFDIVKLEGRLEYKDEEQGSTARHRIRFEQSSNGDYHDFQADDLGYFGGFVAKGEELTMKVFNDCGQLVADENVGSYYDDTSLLKQLDTDVTCTLIPVSGQLIDCAGRPVNEGYVSLGTTENTLFLSVDEQGYYSGHLRVCSTGLPLTLFAGDLTNNQASHIHTGLRLTDSLQIGTWQVCDDADGSITLQFLNEIYLFTDQLSFVSSSGSLLFEGSSPELWMDCLIDEFKGPGEYRIPSENEAEFILTVEPLHGGTGPALVPKNLDALASYVLVVDTYTPGKRVSGIMEGLARDKNQGDRSGMMYVQFDIPYVN